MRRYAITLYEYLNNAWQGAKLHSPKVLFVSINNYDGRHGNMINIKAADHIPSVGYEYLLIICIIKMLISV